MVKPRRAVERPPRQQASSELSDGEAGGRSGGGFKGMSQGQRVGMQAGASKPPAAG